MRAKRFALGFGIAIIFPMMLYYGVDTFSPSPDFEDFRVEDFSERHQRANVDEQKQLEAERSELDERFREELMRFHKRLFYVSVPLGIAAIIAGAYIALPAVGTGLIFGGILSIVLGYMGYWIELPEPVKFVSLLIAFIVLVVVGYKKLEKR